MRRLESWLALQPVVDEVVSFADAQDAIAFVRHWSYSLLDGVGLQARIASRSRQREWNVDRLTELFDTDSAGYKAFEAAVGQDGMIRISCVAEHLGKVTVRLRVGDPKERLSTAGNENRSRHFSDLYGHSDSTPIHRIVSRRRVAAQS